MKKIVFWLLFTLYVLPIYAQGDGGIAPHQIGAYGAGADSVLVSNGTHGAWMSPSDFREVLDIQPNSLFYGEAAIQQIRAAVASASADNLTINGAIIGDSNYDTPYRFHTPLLEKLYSCIGRASGVGFVDAAVTDTDNPVGIERILGTWTSTAHPNAEGLSPALGAAYTSTTGTAYTVQADGTGSIYSKYSAVTIYYLDNDFGTGRYRIDNGTWTSFVSTNSGIEAKINVSSLSYDEHTIEVELLAAGPEPLTIYGFNLKADEENAVRIHKLANGGTNATTWLGRYSSSGIPLGILADLDLKFLFWMMGTNDNTASYTPEQTWNNSKAFLDLILAQNPNLNIVIVAPMDRLTGTGDPSIPMRLYGDYYKMQAKKFGFAYFDQYAALGDYDIANANGLFADPVHLNVAGGHVPANYVFSNLFSTGCNIPNYSDGFGISINNGVVSKKTAQQVSSSGLVLDPTFDSYRFNIGGGGTSTIEHTNYDIGMKLFFTNNSSSSNHVVTINGATNVYQDNVLSASKQLTVLPRSMVVAERTSGNWVAVTVGGSAPTTPTTLTSGYNIDVTLTGSNYNVSQKLSQNVNIDNSVLDFNRMYHNFNIPGGGTLKLPDAAPSGSILVIMATNTSPGTNSNLTVESAATTLYFNEQNIGQGNIAMNSTDICFCQKQGTRYMCRGVTENNLWRAVQIDNVGSGLSTAGSVLSIENPNPQGTTTGALQRWSGTAWTETPLLTTNGTSNLLFDATTTNAFVGISGIGQMRFSNSGWAMMPIHSSAGTLPTLSGNGMEYTDLTVTNKHKRFVRLNDRTESVQTRNVTTQAFETAATGGAIEGDKKYYRYNASSNTVTRALSDAKWIDGETIIVRAQSNDTGSGQGDVVLTAPSGFGFEVDNFNTTTVTTYIMPISGIVTITRLGTTFVINE